MRKECPSRWISDRYHDQHGPSVWFRAKHGTKQEFQSSNDEKNEGNPVLNIEQFDQRPDARRAANLARECWGGRASVRVHQRVTQVDSIALEQWFVITRERHLNREGA